MPLLKVFARKGSVVAQYHLGTHHRRRAKRIPLYSSDKVHRDLAIRFLTDAANAGCAEAAYDLGKLYLCGRRAYQEPHTAVGWFRKAATKGHPRAVTYYQHPLAGISSLTTCLLVLFAFMIFNVESTRYYALILLAFVAFCFFAIWLVLDRSAPEVGISLALTVAVVPYIAHDLTIYWNCFLVSLVVTGAMLILERLYRRKLCMIWKPLVIPTEWSRS